mgnify:CR=1 FL=1|tara:strand:- start:1928 stop:2200 length:273 start_codon:yes stop_codon:yes gene_type:complete
MKLTTSKLQQIIEEELKLEARGYGSLNLKVPLEVWNTMLGAYKRATTAMSNLEEDQIKIEALAKKGQITDIQSFLNHPWVKGRSWYWIFQ